MAEVAELMKPAMARFRLSGWTFDGSNSAGLKIIASVTGGNIDVKSPRGESRRFWYGGIGGGPGAGIKLPVKGKVVNLDTVVKKYTSQLGKREANGTAFFPNGGWILVNERRSSDLEISHFQGPIVLVEASANIVFGISGSFMLIGLADRWPDTEALFAFLNNQVAGTIEALISSSAGIIASGGLGAAAAASIGAVAYAGYMR